MLPFDNRYFHQDRPSDISSKISVAHVIWYSLKIDLFIKIAPGNSFKISGRTYFLFVENWSVHQDRSLKVRLNYQGVRVFSPWKWQCSSRSPPEACVEKIEIPAARKVCARKIARRPRYRNGPPERSFLNLDWIIGRVSNMNVHHKSYDVHFLSENRPMIDVQIGIVDHTP